MTQLQALDCTGSFGSAGRLPTEGTPVWAQLRALHCDEGTVPEESYMPASRGLGRLLQAGGICARLTQQSTSSHSLTRHGLPALRCTCPSRSHPPGAASGVAGVPYRLRPRCAALAGLPAPPVAVRPEPASLWAHQEGSEVGSAPGGIPFLPWGQPQRLLRCSLPGADRLLLILLNRWRARLRLPQLPRH